MFFLALLLLFCGAVGYDYRYRDFDNVVSLQTRHSVDGPDDEIVGTDVSRVGGSVDD